MYCFYLYLFNPDGRLQIDKFIRPSAIFSSVKIIFKRTSRFVSKCQGHIIFLQLFCKSVEQTISCTFSIPKAIFSEGLKLLKLADSFIFLFSLMEVSLFISRRKMNQLDIFANCPYFVHLTMRISIIITSFFTFPHDYMTAISSIMYEGSYI